MISAENIWKAALGNIQLCVTKSCYDTWFADTKGLALEDGTFKVGVKDDFTATCLKDHHLSIIEKHLFKQLNQKVNIAFIVGWDTQRVQERDKNVFALFHINPDLSFENFVVGPCNSMAHAAAVSAASGEADSLYNPLFICASPGLGKTHLLQAIGQRSLENNLRPLYTSCSALITECFSSFQNGTTESLKEKYSSADVLMIDDIHDLAGKDSAQNIFFNIFNTSREAGHQIVVTSDRTPKDMDHIADRLKSRFEWGLITDIQTPDLDTRVAILRTRAQNRKLDITDDILYYIAEEECTNVRELEGRLNKVEAYARFLSEPITQELARKALRRIMNSNPTVENKVIDAKKVINEVASSFGVTPESLLSPSREQKIALARQVAMYVLKQYGFSLIATGKVLGNRTPSTVSHALDKIGKILIDDEEMKAIVDKICASINKQ